MSSLQLDVSKSVQLFYDFIYFHLIIYSLNFPFLLYLLHIKQTKFIKKNYNNVFGHSKENPDCLCSQLNPDILNLFFTHVNRIFIAPKL